MSSKSTSKSQNLLNRPQVDRLAKRGGIFRKSKNVLEISEAYTDCALDELLKEALAVALSQGQYKSEAFKKKQNKIITLQPKHVRSALETRDIVVYADDDALVPKKPATRKRKEAATDKDEEQQQSQKKSKKA